MTIQNKPESPAATEKRLQAFLDCVARLMAKRWVDEQRENVAMTSSTTKSKTSRRKSRQ